MAGKQFKLRSQLVKGEGFATFNPETKLHYVSASHISDFRRCPKRWYHKAVDKVKEPEKPGAELGSQVHSFIEEALAGQEPSGFSEKVRGIALSGQRFWPKPGTQMEIEKEFVLEDPLVKLPMYGFIDIQTPQEVIDHKTTSDIQQWGKNAEQWRNDPQCAIYSAYNLSIGGSPRFRIIYYQTRGRKAEEVVVDQSLTQLRFQMCRIAEDVDKMLEYAQKPLAEVPHNEEACGDYGGCYMRNLCAKVGVTPANLGAYADVWAALYQTPEPAKPENKKENKEMSMSEALSYRERMAAQRAAAAAKAAQLSDPETEEGGVALPVSVNPPDGVAQSPATKEELESVMAVIAPVTAAAPAATASDEDEDEVPPAPPAPGERRGPGRPPGAKNRKPAEAIATQAPEPVSTPPVQTSSPVVASTDVVDIEKRIATLSVELAEAKMAAEAALSKQKQLRALVVDGDDDALEQLPAAKKEAEAASSLVEAVSSRLADAKSELEVSVRVAQEAAKKAEEAKKAEQAKKAAAVAAPASAPTLSVLQAVSSSPVIVTNTTGRRTMYLGCSPERDTEGLVHFDDWVQQFARRAESARQTPYYRMLPHNAVDAVMAEILADLRSGAQQPPMQLVFRRFSAQYFQYAQDLRPFYDEVIS